MTQQLPPVICVAPELVDSAWPLVEHIVQPCYEGMDEFVPENLIPWLKAGKGLLWIVFVRGKPSAACITSLEPRPSGLVCRITALGGEKMENWKRCEDVIADYARREGCVKIMGEGRSGWARSFPDYRVVRVIVEKAL